jgi:hypothetical protein
MRFGENPFFFDLFCIFYFQSLAGTGVLVNIDIENKKDPSNGLLIEVIEPIESIEMTPLNNNNNNSRQIIASNDPSLLMPPDCCPRMISRHFDGFKYLISQSIQQKWTSLRSKAHRLVEHRFFEWLIIASILASSTTLVS